MRNYRALARFAKQNWRDKRENWAHSERADRNAQAAAKDEKTKGRGMMAKMVRSVRMRGMNLLHFVLMTALMMTVWFTLCAPQAAMPDVQTVSIAVCACYAILSVFFYRTYNAYKIGMNRAGETFYSQTLANLFSNFLTYIFACIIQLRLMNVLPVLLVFVGQTVISAVWCRLANQLYFKLHKPMRTLVIYKDDEDLEKLHEIVCFENRFNIQNQIKDPQDVFDVLPKIRDYQAIIVSGVDATMRNGIVKECIDKDIDCFFIPHTGDVIISGAKHMQSFSIPIMEAKRAMLKPEYAFAKRLLDILLASVALVFASPFMVATAIAIKAYDHGPVLYRQVRLTRDGKCFEILNVRCMGSVGYSA